MIQASQYRISRNIGGDLNLAIWQMLDKSPNLKIANLIFVHLSHGTANISMAMWKYVKQEH